FKAPISREALSSGIIGNSNPPANASDVSVYKSEEFCLFHLNSSYYLTWAQARDFCALYNATLPMMRTAYGWQRLRIYIENRRFWTGFVRTGSSEWTWQSGSDFDGSLATEDFVKTGNTTGIEWSKSEPSYSYCVENCTMVSYDGNLADYPCENVPPWDSCAEPADVVLTVCHRSDIEVCRYTSNPPAIPTPHDYYIIVGATFAALIGCAGAVLGVRLIVKTLERRDQPDSDSQQAAEGRKLRKQQRRRAEQEGGQELGFAS
uniref:C-type lectin domain-containing protein n=1 Tax=Macrostomum lignano TaxID=282301 RepID=A0A1I8HBV4_9PLAT